MAKIDVDRLKKEWFSFEEIDSILKWTEDIENGDVFTEEEFYNEINSKIFSKYKKSHV